MELNIGNCCSEINYPSVQTAESQGHPLPNIHLQWLDFTGRDFPPALDFSKFKHVVLTGNLQSCLGDCHYFNP